MSADFALQASGLFLFSVSKYLSGATFIDKAHNFIAERRIIIAKFFS